MAKAKQVRMDDALQNENFENQEDFKKENDAEQISVEIKDAIASIAETIKKQNEIIAEQQKKIEEQDKKINDIIGVITALLQSGGAGVLDQNPNGMVENTENNQEEVNIPGNAPNSGQPAVSNQTQPQQQNPFNADRLTELIKSIAIITSNVGGPKEPPNPVGSIHDAISIASSIAGALGEGLARVFDAFNQMEERAFKSYATRFKSIKFDDSDIEKAVERAIEKKLKFLVKEEKQEE